jgi:hypothetical protein
MVFGRRLQSTAGCGDFILFEIKAVKVQAGSYDIVKAAMQNTIALQ